MENYNYMPNDEDENPTNPPHEEVLAGTNFNAVYDN